jgi:hypothetical protein
MALVWAEPWDQYGGNASLLANSGYSTNVGSLVTPGRTGNYCIRFNNSTGFVKPLVNVATKLGIGVAINPVSGIGGTSYLSSGLAWYSSGNTFEMSAVLNSDYSVAIFDRTHTLVGKTPPGLLIASSWQFVEVVAIQNSGGTNTGYAEVRINGVSQCIVNNINLPNQFTAFGLQGNSSGNVSMDDWFAWDGTGTQNNTFIGDRRLVFCVPNGNGVPQNFTFTGATAWQSCNLVPPVDTTYIDGAAAGNTSEFTKQAMGLASTNIAAVVVMGRIFKTDAGVATASIGIDSAGHVLNSAAIAPGTSGAFYYFPVELDPNGNVAWTQPNVDAANIVINRVS